MTRDEQIFFCKKCINRVMNPQQGYVCKLTGEKATFDVQCSDYSLDEKVKEPEYDNQESLPVSELEMKLPNEALNRLKMEQKLLPGILSGLLVGLIGALVWGYITVLTEYQIGYMALAIGAGVGFTIRKFGNGIDYVFGICGAIISFLSVLLGNILSIIGFVANSEGIGLFDAILRFEYSFLPTLIADTFSPVDLLFYGIAIYEGYRFSFRIITEKTAQTIK